MNTPGTRFSPTGDGGCGAPHPPHDTGDRLRRTPDRAWEPIIAGLRFHDLRHTHRTWMDEDAIPEALKSQHLGHQPPGICGFYAHVTDTMQHRLVDSPATTVA